MSGCKMLCFQRNWFRADLCEMARSCSKLQQVDKLCKYAENSTIKVFYWGWLRVSFARVLTAARKLSTLRKMCKKVGGILSGVL